MAFDIAKILSSFSDANIRKFASYPGGVPNHLNYANLDQFPGIPRVQDSFFSLIEVPTDGRMFENGEVNFGR